MKSDHIHNSINIIDEVTDLNSTFHLCIKVDFHHTCSAVSTLNDRPCSFRTVHKRFTLVSFDNNGSMIFVS